MTNIRIAGVQISACTTESETLRKAERWIDTAASEGAKMVCLPELFANPFIGREKREEWRDLAQTTQGPLMETLKEISTNYDIGLLAPFYEWDPEESTGYNSAVFLEQGSILATYRKTYIPMTSLNFERYYFSPGDGSVPVVSIGNVNMSAIICYDRHFPELARLATFRGARVLLIPTASADRVGRTNTYTSELVGLAAANGLYVMGVNRTGVEGSTAYFGGSSAIGPDGTVLKTLDQDEGLVWMEVNSIDQDDTRERFGHLRDVRKDVFKQLLSSLDRGTGI